jgi:hypothetical protein
MGEMRNAYKILVGKLEGKNHLEDQGIDGKTVRTDLMKRGWEVVDWLHLAQDKEQWWAVVTTVMNLWVS